MNRRIQVNTPHPQRPQFCRRSETKPIAIRYSFDNELLDYLCVRPAKHEQECYIGYCKYCNVRVCFNDICVQTHLQIHHGYLIS